MLGLKIQQASRIKAPFGFCFRSTLPLLNSYYWIVQQDSFQQLPRKLIDASVYDESIDRYVEGPLCRFDDLRLDAVHDYVYFGPGLLPEFSPGITEDWNELYGFVEPLSNFQDWVEKRFGDNRAKLVEDTAAVCFFNIDAAYWEIYAKDSNMIEGVQTDMESEPSVTVKSANLEKSFGL